MPDPQADGVHVSPEEAAQAADPAVGRGTPDTAPEVLYVDGNYKEPTSWVPTRKWLLATTLAAGTLATLFAQHGWHWDEHTSIPTIGFAVQRLASYWVPNEERA